MQSSESASHPVYLYLSSFYGTSLLTADFSRDKGDLDCQFASKDHHEPVTPGQRRRRRAGTLTKTGRRNTRSRSLQSCSRFMRTDLPSVPWKTGESAGWPRQPVILQVATHVSLTGAWPWVTTVAGSHVARHEQGRARDVQRADALEWSRLKTPAMSK